MTLKDIAEDYDPALMQTKDAKYFKNHLEDFHSDLNHFLASNNILFNFINPFLDTYFNKKQSFINHNFNRFEARAIALKESIDLMDEFIKNQISSSEFQNELLNQFDLDINSVIDTDKM